MEVGGGWEYGYVLPVIGTSTSHPDSPSPSNQLVESQASLETQEVSPYPSYNYI